MRERERAQQSCPYCLRRTGTRVQGPQMGLECCGSSLGCETMGASEALEVWPLGRSRGHLSAGQNLMR